MQTQNTPKVQGTWLRKGVRDCKRQRESDALLSMVSPNNIRSYTYKFDEPSPPNQGVNKEYINEYVKLHRKSP